MILHDWFDHLEKKVRVLHYLDLHVQDISHHFLLPKETPDCQNADMLPLHTARCN